MSRALTMGGVSPAETAESLQTELDRLKISSDVHDGYGLALVSVWVGLVVWCDGDRSWWRTGWDVRRGRFVYAWHCSTEPARAARRVAFQYAHLREHHSPAWLTPDTEGIDHGPR